MLAENPQAHVANDQLLAALAPLDSTAAAERLSTENDTAVISALRHLSPVRAVTVFEALPDERRAAIEKSLPPKIRDQWRENLQYPEGSVGRLMEHTDAILPESLTCAQATERLREIARNEFLTYGFVINAAGKLIGVLVMRDILFSRPETPIADIMLRNPFTLAPDAPLMDAMRLVVTKHFPIYPVCDAQGKLIGIVRGFRLFEEQAVEISAQPGRMVGVEREEQLETPWTRSLKQRHPWLQLNLLTAFIAGGVVSFFQDTINQIVVLASFLPVLAGQSGNTGCQALAVTLRGMTLGHLSSKNLPKLLAKEALLGLFNGAMVGVSAGVGMYLLASSQHNPNALGLSLVVVFAMTMSCMVSGLSGALVPMVLKKLGADPATASSIFLTTATDVASMGLLLGVATWVFL